MINKIPDNDIQRSGYLANSAKASASDGKTVSSQDKKKAGLQEDTLMLSNEGKAAQEVARYAQMAQELPEVDGQKLQQVMENIRNGSYFTPEAADAVAGKLMESIEDGGTA